MSLEKKKYRKNVMRARNNILINLKFQICGLASFGASIWIMVEREESLQLSKVDSYATFDYVNIPGKRLHNLASFICYGALGCNYILVKKIFT